MENIFADFLLNKGLYDSQVITRDNIEQLIDLIDGNVKLDCYCPICKKQRVFNGIRITDYWEDEDRDDIFGRPLADIIKRHQNLVIQNVDFGKNIPWEWMNEEIKESARLMTFKFLCSMNERHHLDFVVLADETHISKIGQFPSVADLNKSELDKYKKILPKEDAKELRRAEGLFAQGIGVGSYVYLRRVIERLIDREQEKAVTAGVIDRSSIENERVSGKIRLLKNSLPRVLTESPQIYGILSKGIHELSEDECMQYYPVLWSGILLILDQEATRRLKEQQETDFRKSIANISGELR